MQVEQGRKEVVVVGHGMVGHRFVEALWSRDTDSTWRVTVLAEEADAAYDRVALTSYTEHWGRAQMALAGNCYDGDSHVRLVLGERATSIDRETKTVHTETATFDYDALVLPGGQINPDLLRVNEDALALIKSFYAAGKPIAAICHAPWLLIEAGVMPCAKL